MGLKQLFSKNKSSGMDVPQIPNANKGIYNMNWLSKQALAFGIEPSDNQSVVTEILKDLEMTHGQCPSGGEGARFKCPCIRVRETNTCTCGLFKSIPQRRVSGSSSAQIRRNDE